MTDVHQHPHLSLVLPELILLLTGIFTILNEVRLKKTRRSSRSREFPWLPLTGLFFALIGGFVTLQIRHVHVFMESLLVDPVTQFFKLIFIFSGFMVILLGWKSKEIKKDEQTEFRALIILSTLGLCLISSAVHLFLLFLAFETVSYAFYVLAAFKRRSDVSTEAGIKFFVYGALSSILFAFGIVMLYGVGKSFYVFDVQKQLMALVSGEFDLYTSAYLWVAFGLIFVSIATRMAAFPFHFIVVDVIEGALIPVSAFLSITLSAMAATFGIRICLQIFSEKGGLSWGPLTGLPWTEFLAIVSAITMTVGNLTALFQVNIKRLLGFACMAQIGFILMGFSVSNNMGVASVLFSLGAFSVVTIGTYFVVQWISAEAKSEDVHILRGLGWKSPFEAVILGLFLLSLAGIPPLVGFVGRFYVLGVVMQQKIYWLAVVAALNWVIGLSYYLTLIKQMFAVSAKSVAKDAPPAALGRINSITLVGLVIPTIGLGIYWEPLMQYIIRSLRYVPW